MCFLNAVAARTLVTVETAKAGEHDIPTHCPVFVTLSIPASTPPERGHWIPTPFPKKPPLMTQEEMRSILTTALDRNRAVSGADGALRNASEVAEAYLTGLHRKSLPPGSTAYRGRAGGFTTRKAHASARQACTARGATDWSVRQRDKVIGMLRTVIAEARQRLSVGQRSAMTVAERNARNALHRSTAKESLAQHPSTGDEDELQYLVATAEKLVGSQREAVAELKTERSRLWKERIQKAWGSQEKGAIYRFLAGQQGSPSVFLRRGDGTLTACPREIDEMLRGPEAWGGIFQKYTDIPEPQWEAFKTHYARYLPAPHAMECRPIGAADVDAALKKMKKTTSPGLHGWRVHELRQLPPEILELMADAMNAVETEGQWPEQLMHAIVHLLPKPESTGDPLSQRPISITPVLYRIWAAIRAKEALAWMDEIAPSGMHGCRKEHGTDDLIWHLAALIEEAHLTGEPLYGLALDFRKCFDSVPIEIAFKLAGELGFNEVVLRTLRVAYASMQRHFRMGATVGEGFIPTNGIMQGCPLSVILINVLISVWMRHIADIEAAIPLSYVDDVYAMLKSLANLEEAARRSGRFAGLTGMKVCTQKKSHFFTTAPHAPQTIEYAESKGEEGNSEQTELIQRRTTFDALGAMITTDRVPPGRRYNRQGVYRKETLKPSSY
ncbi:hypothetical protein DIPPA_06767 [Diplonema papillatum]|nr:hypothetical protein DIPPA_06767 [Diplonema papillatum]